MLQPAVLAEGDGPVGSVVADRGGDLEAARQLGVDGDFGSGFEPSGELRFHALFGVAVGEHPVLHAFADPDGVGFVAPTRVCEDGGIVFALDPVVADVVHDHRSLLLDDKPAHLGDELLRVVLEICTPFDISLLLVEVYFSALHFLIKSLFAPTPSICRRLNNIAIGCHNFISKISR